MVVKKLPTGWTLLWINRECWAQVPPGYDYEGGVEDEFIFNPDWNREAFQAQEGSGNER